MILSKAKILSSIVGVIMVVSIFKSLIATVILGILGAGLWIKGEDYIK